MFRSIVKMMQNAGKFLSYPILQYIPISINTLAQTDQWSNPFNQPSPQLFLFQDEDALRSALNRFQIQLQKTPPDGDLYVLCLNFQTELVLFRYLTCKIIGEEQLGSVHVFAITKKYFPRRSLHFGLFENDGRKLRGINQVIY
ncbi:hypothetical protein [Dethiobacter alkaliphilus]|uniref:hypothetical protein n=1 Tax=Dethiobacter alkaliphilus TaxID=427926 RepID=UPI002226CE60|nr:hypothetical protein [Dethiobacter alkaliphilus]MCW3490559.1 hypothetical protein [Dethiobacter alkaliphilus]